MAKCFPTSSPFRLRRAGERGLTLIELTVSLVIVGVLFAAVAIGVGAVTGSRARATMGELGGVVRSLYDTAALGGKTCRLVIDLGPADREGRAQDIEYRAECAEGTVTQGKSEEPEPDPHTDSDRPSSPFPSASDFPSLEDITLREKHRVEAAAKYQSFNSAEVQPRKLSGVNVSVWTQGREKPVTSGLAYLYFFPQGYTQRAQVVVQQGDNAWTLRVAGLTGKTSVVSGALEVPK